MFQKVEKLLKAIHCQDAELLAAKVVVDQQYTLAVTFLNNVARVQPRTSSAGVPTSQVQQMRHLRP
jgi:hypothetical protein